MSGSLCVKEGAKTEFVTVGVLTISDRCARGDALDESGTNLQTLVTSGHLVKGRVVQYLCVPDNPEEVVETLKKWCDTDRLQLILTTGGTGLSPRDQTPEAVKQVVTREAPGLSLCMLLESLKITPLASLSRPVCGTRGNTLIITLPGSKKASEECLRSVALALPHALDLLAGHDRRVEHAHSQLQAQGVVSAATKSHHQPRPPHAHHHHHHHHHHHPHHHHHSHQQQQQDSNSTKESKADVSQVSRRARKSPYPMISVAQATELVLAQAVECGQVTVPMDEALGFVLAQDIHAKDPLPPFPASIKDGYAVVAADGAGSRQVTGDSTAGAGPEDTKVTPGTCVRINTGAPVPPGADAVVQVEDTELLKEADDGKTELEINILKAPQEEQDIRPLGCDISVGEKVVCQGTVLGPAELGLLATVGATSLLVMQKPVIAILSTGNELQEGGEELREGHVRDSNKTTLLALVRQAGFPVVDAGIARDDPTTLLASVRAALTQADILVTTGSVSMGERDILRPVLQADLQAEIHFAQVFMKPGKPTTLATCTVEGKKKVVLGLPGNPVSAIVTATLYLLPLARRMSGQQQCLSPCISAKLSEDVWLDPRPEYHRVSLAWVAGDAVPLAVSTGNQISSRLLSMRSAQALLRLPPATQDTKTLPKGAVVDALVLNL